MLINYYLDDKKTTRAEIQKHLSNKDIQTLIAAAIYSIEASHEINGHTIKIVIND